MLKLIPVQYRVAAIVGILVVWTLLVFNHGKKLERAKWVASQLEETENSIEELAEDSRDNQETAKQIETIIKYKDRVIYETITKEIQADCPDGAAELTGMLNLVMEETNSAMPVHSD